MSIFKIVGLLVLEKKMFKGVYYICASRPSWSCDLDHLLKRLFSFLRRPNMKFGFDGPSGFRGDV